MARCSLIVAAAVGVVIFFASSSTAMSEEPWQPVCTEPDWYSVLGLQKTCRADEVRKARLDGIRKARQLQDESLEALINSSFDVLGDEMERKRYDTYGHADMTPIREGIWLGGESAARRPELLRKLGITHVLTAAHSLEYLEPALKRHGLTHKILNVEDSDSQEIASLFKDTNQFIAEGRSSGGILIHCQYGMSRSPSFLAAYLIQTEGMNDSQAVQSLQQARNKVRPGNGFLKQLQQFSESLQHSRPEQAE